MDIEKEFSDLIKNTLADHEEDYIVGSWENYVNKQKKRRRQIYRRYGIGIAASILIGLICLNLFHLSDTNDFATQKKHISSITNPINSIQKNSESITSEKNITFDNKNINAINIIETEWKLPIAILQEKPSISSENIATQNDTIKVVSVKNRITDSTNYRQYTRTTIPDEINDPYKTKDTYVTKDHGSKRKVRFGINIAPGFNSTSTASSYNYSGGVNVDIALSKTIQLSTGMQIERQSVVSKNAALNTAIPSDHTSADLVNLDFPLNITWKFLSRGLNSFYVSGGISSLAYLSEKYRNTSYKQELRAVATMSGEQEPKTYKLENIESTTGYTEPPFHAFNLAGRINLMFGIEHQLSPKLSLHIEPYLKIPVSPLASENLKYTTSGVTCKISF